MVAEVQVREGELPPVYSSLMEHGFSTVFMTIINEAWVVKTLTHFFILHSPLMAEFRVYLTVRHIADTVYQPDSAC